MTGSQTQTQHRAPTSSPNGPTSTGQNQYLVGENALATMTSSIDKGGMRGIGLLLMAIAEFSLKKKAVDLAKDYYDTNKRDYDHFRSVHQPLIQGSVQEAFNNAMNPTYNYDTYASVPAGIAKTSILDKQWFETRRRLSRYNIGQAQRINYDFAALRSHAVVAGWNIATRYEYAWTDDHNNRAFDKKLAVTNIGIGVGNIVRQGLSAAVGNLATSYDHIGDTIASIGNGVSAKAGYFAGIDNAQQRYRNE